jgi:putative oxidoreductase
MRPLFVLGRLIFGGFFVYNGINHFMNRHGMAQYASAKGVPSADVAVAGSGAMLLAGGASIIAGLNPRQGLAAVLGFLIPVTLQMHRFWEIEDPQQRMTETVQFAKNVALIGAALMLLQLEHPWPASIDSARTEEEMYVRLGGRDLRALPA